MSIAWWSSAARIVPFPSPGGDVLCLEYYIGLVKGRHVSVPWRGCVVSYSMFDPARHILFPSPGGDVLCHLRSPAGACAFAGFRPLAGMCCVTSAALSVPVVIKVSVPWRGCVVSRMAAIPFPGGQRFRPLAGMCCVCWRGGCAL